jgi:hypothetical protein
MKHAVTWAQIVRDVLLSAMARGQLPLLGLIAVVFLVVYRLPEAELAGMVERIFELWKNGDGLGWLFWLATTSGWVWHARATRRGFQGEYDRMGKEKADLQKLLTGKKFPSSRR